MTLQDQMLPPAVMAMSGGKRGLNFLSPIQIAALQDVTNSQPWWTTSFHIEEMQNCFGARAIGKAFVDTITAAANKARSDAEIGSVFRPSDMIDGG